MNVEDKVEKEYLFRCSSIQLKICIFFVFMVTFASMTVFIWMDCKAWTLTLYGVFLLLMFIICCVLGNWLSQAEGNVHSVIEARKDGLFLSTVLPVCEFSTVNTEICTNRHIPTHVHNVEDMINDFNPILFESENININNRNDSTCSLENFHVINGQLPLNEMLSSRNSGMTISTTWSSGSIGLERSRSLVSVESLHSPAIDHHGPLMFCSLHPLNRVNEVEDENDQVASTVHSTSSLPLYQDINNGFVY